MAKAKQKLRGHICVLGHVRPQTMKLEDFSASQGSAVVVTSCHRCHFSLTLNHLMSLNLDETLSAC